MSGRGKGVKSEEYWQVEVQYLMDEHGLSPRDAVSEVVLDFLLRGDVEPIAFHLRRGELLNANVHTALGVMLSGEQTPSHVTEKSHPFELVPKLTPVDHRKFRTKGTGKYPHPKTMMRDKWLAKWVDARMDEWGTEKYSAYDAAIADTLKELPAFTEAIIRNAHSRYGRHSRKPK